jgi:Uma2 family endonuclease
VLSETTAEFDRTRKLPYYRQIQSVQHILFVESERKLVEHHQRVQPHQWLVSELSPPHRLTLNDCTIYLNAFYDQVDF